MHVAEILFVLATLALGAFVIFKVARQMDKDVVVTLFLLVIFFVLVFTVGTAIGIHTEMNRSAPNTQHKVQRRLSNRMNYAVLVGYRDGSDLIINIPSGRGSHGAIRILRIVKVRKLSLPVPRKRHHVPNGADEFATIIQP